MGVGDTHARGCAMDQRERAETEVSDQALVESARSGDRSAFAELWRRHARSGITVARQFTSSLDADDLVSEAYARIYQRVLGGGGPDGAFRPYLYTTIRNLASRWGAARNDIQIDDLDDLEDESVPADASIEALDRSLTVRAFRSLPERWQSVLWYTEVEGMDPHEVAPILGITANSVAALSYRAREGLRKAWLQAHVSVPGRTEDCKWAINRLADNARHSLTTREQDKLGRHLSGCLSCAIVSEEVEDVGSRLALVVLPLLLGATAGGTLLASLSASGPATAAAMPTMPPAFETVSLGTAGSAGQATVASLGAVATLGKPILVGALAVSLAIGGGVAATVQPPMRVDQSQANVAVPGPVAEPDTDSNPAPIANGDGGHGSVDASATVASPSVLDSGLVSDVTNPINAILPKLPVGPVPEHVAPGGVVGALLELDLNGKGMPRATVSAQVAGQVYTTIVANDGTWAIRLTALPTGVGPITLKQRLTVLGIPVPIGIPLTLLSDTLGVTVELLN